MNGSEILGLISTAFRDCCLSHVVMVGCQACSAESHALLVRHDTSEEEAAFSQHATLSFPKRVAGSSSSRAHLWLLQVSC